MAGLLAAEDLHPQPNCQIVPLRGHEVWAQFRTITIFKKFGIKRNCASEEFHVFAVAGRVPLQLREREVVGVEPKEPQGSIRGREYRCQPMFVAFVHCYDGHVLDVHAVLGVTVASSPRVHARIGAGPAGRSTRLHYNKFCNNLCRCELESHGFESPGYNRLTGAAEYGSCAWNRVQMGSCRRPFAVPRDQLQGPKRAACQSGAKRRFVDCEWLANLNLQVWLTEAIDRAMELKLTVLKPPRKYCTVRSQ